MPEKQTRPKYQTRHIMLIGDMQKETAHHEVDIAPIDAVYPLELIIREAIKPRKKDQNALYWAGPLKDIEEQAWYKGQQYIAEVWHDMYKRMFLPEKYEEGITKEGYVKWAYAPDGVRVLVGSTTQLTVKGFSQYLEKVHADGASMGVRFSAVER